MPRLANDDLVGVLGRQSSQVVVAKIHEPQSLNRYPHCLPRAYLNRQMLESGPAHFPIPFAVLKKQEIVFVDFDDRERMAD